MCNQLKRRLLFVAFVFCGIFVFGCGGAKGKSQQTAGKDGSPESKVDNNDIAEAQQYMDQAAMETSNGDMRAALSSYLEAARIYDETDAVIIDRAEAHFLAAGIAYDLGSKEQSVKEYDAAVQIYIRFSGNSKVKAAVALNNMGTIYKEMGQKDKARNCWNDALQIYKEAPAELQSKSNIATIEQNLSDLQEGF